MTTGRPPLSTHGKATAPRTIRLTPELNQALQDHVKTTGTPASKVIREALAQYLANLEQGHLPDEPQRNTLIKALNMSALETENFIRVDRRANGGPLQNRGCTTNAL